MSSDAFSHSTIHSEPAAVAPSWLATIGHARNCLWSVDLFRAESILLKSYWVMVVMDVHTPRIIGFDVEAANLGGIGVCKPAKPTAPVQIPIALKL